jgi:predicted MPP superfamily phosphohydrolase
LAILEGIRAPLYGVLGNHEYWSKSSFAPISRSFSASGGAWLLDEQVRTQDGQVTLSGLTCQSQQRAPLKANPKSRNILLLHYPAWVKKLGNERYDLMLAAHSHGGQGRLPFMRAPKLAFAVDEYELDLFQTRNGPLYVNPGIGWFATPIRFRCRPEITVIEI